MLKLLEVPIPPIAAAVIPQVAPSFVGGAPEGPGWVATFLLGGWVVLWFMDRIGKLPGRPQGERRSTSAFTDKDRELLGRISADLSALVELEVAAKTDKVYNLLATRDPEDGIERFLKFLQETKATRGLMVEIDHKLEEVLRHSRQGGA